MSTISVPLSPELQQLLDSLVRMGSGANKADVMRRALERFGEEEAVNRILKARREPTLRGDLVDLLDMVD